MPQIAPVFVFAFVFVVKYAGASGDFEKIEDMAKHMFDGYIPMPTKWSSAFLANFVQSFNKKSVCSRELVKELIVKLDVWKAIVNCYVECATRQADGVLKMDYEEWHRVHITGIGYEALAPHYIGILPIGDKNHIGKKLADYFAIVMQYVGSILECMKVCFIGKEDLVSAALLRLATTKFDELSPRQTAIVAKMKE